MRYRCSTQNVVWNQSIHPFCLNTLWLSHSQSILLHGKIDKDTERIYVYNVEIKINKKLSHMFRIHVHCWAHAQSIKRWFLRRFQWRNWRFRVHSSWNMNLWSSIRGWSHLYYTRRETVRHTHTQPRILLMFLFFFSPFLFHSFLENQHFFMKTVWRKVRWTAIWRENEKEKHENTYVCHAIIFWCACVFFLNEYVYAVGFFLSFLFYFVI